MKRILLILVFALVSCYDDDSTQIISDDIAHISSKLTSNLKSISLHDASYDDLIDNSSCFSLEFPYDVLVNAELQTINSIEDIEALNEDDIIEIVYPVSAVLFNYEKHQINASSDYASIVNACENSFDLDPHRCIDFEYPVRVKMYNQVGNSFQTVTLNHDQDMYVYFDNLQEADIYEIEYPIQITDHTTGTTKAITSNTEFEAVFTDTHGNCQ